MELKEKGLKEKPRSKVEGGEKLSNRILVAEPNDIIRGNLEETFRAQGYEVVTVANLEGVFHELVISGQKFSIIIIDDGVGGTTMEGFRLVEQIHSIDKELPVIVLSTGTVSDPLKITSLGGAYMEKPFNLNELEAKVNDLLNPEATPAE